VSYLLLISLGLLKDRLRQSFAREAVMVWLAEVEVARAEEAAASALAG